MDFLTLDFLDTAWSVLLTMPPIKKLCKPRSRRLPSVRVLKAEVDALLRASQPLGERWGAD